MAVELRDYQEQAVNDCLFEMDMGDPNMIVYGPVAMGKSISIAALAIRSGVRTMISVSISDLIPQFVNAFKMLDFDDFTVLKSDYSDDFDPEARIVISMDNTFHARRDKLSGIKYKLLLFDEAHMRLHGERFKEIKRSIEPDYIIGFTGTPFNKHGEMLYGFDTIIKTISMKDLISKGFLTKPKYLIPGWTAKIKIGEKFSGEYTAEDLADQLNDIHRAKVIDTYFDCTDYFEPEKVKSVWFTSNVESAEAYAADLRTKGIHAYAYHGKMKKDLREAIMHAYLTDEPMKVDADVNLFNYLDERVEYVPVKALVAINTLTVGWDSPTTTVEVQCSSSAVLNKLYQLDGRLYRKHPNGNIDKFILDCGLNTKRHGFAHDEYFPLPAGSDIKEVRDKLRSNSLEYLEILLKDENKIYEVSREKYNDTLESIRNDKRPMSELSIDEKIDKLFVEENISELILVYFALFKEIHGDPYVYEKWNPQTQKNEQKEVNGYYKASSVDWVSETWIKAFNNHPEMVKQWIKSFKTKARSLLRKPGNVYAIRFFIEWLIENEIDKHSECYFYVHHTSMSGAIYKYKLTEEFFDGELDEVDSEQYKEYLKKGYDLSLVCKDNIVDAISNEEPDDYGTSYQIEIDIDEENIPF